MLSKISEKYRINEQILRRILFTLGILLVFRLGSLIPVPFIDADVMASLFDGNSLFSFINLASGGAMKQCALLALGVSPFINASIIIQLLSVAIPVLGRMVKEDPDPQRVHSITKYVSLGLSVFMAAGFYMLLRKSNALMYRSGIAGIVTAVAIIVLLMAGAAICTWLGEQIDMYGTGSGTSLIIFTGIVTRWDDIISVWAAGIIFFNQHMWFRFALLLSLPIIMLVLIYFATHINGAEMHIPVKYAMSRPGSKFTANASFIPLKLIMGGVMPIIFAGTLVGLPSTLALFVSAEKHPFIYAGLTFFQRYSLAYLVVYVALILVFNYIYISMQLDVVKIANTLRNNAGTIPGIRPGKPTEEYLMRAAKSMAFCGAVLLSIIASVPILMGNLAGIPAQVGGTSLLIMVSVALEQFNSIRSMNVTQRAGFLRKKGE